MLGCSRLQLDQQIAAFILILFIQFCSSSDADKVAETPAAAAPKLADLEAKVKDEKIHSALGATDELSSFIGLAREFANDSKEEHPYVDKLKRVQMILFDLHHAILRATPGQKKSFEDRHTKDLEEWITEYSNQLPPPEDYIIPVIRAFYLIINNFISFTMLQDNVKI